MIGAIEGGDGWVYRLSPRLKLLSLLVLSVGLFTTAALPVLALLAALVLGLALLLSRPALLQWLKAWPLLVTILAVVAWTYFSTGQQAALTALLRLGTLSLFAALITATTSIGQFIDTITALARPLERIGLANARDIGLAIGLVIRFVPEVQARYRAVRDAHRARGLKPRLNTLVVPLIIGTILSADEIANAIDARNIRAPNPGRD